MGGQEALGGLICYPLYLRMVYGGVLSPTQPGTARPTPARRPLAQPGRVTFWLILGTFLRFRAVLERALYIGFL